MGFCVRSFRRRFKFMRLYIEFLSLANRPKPLLTCSERSGVSRIARSSNSSRLPRLYGEFWHCRTLRRDSPITWKPLHLITFGDRKVLLTAAADNMSALCRALYVNLMKDEVSTAMELDLRNYFWMPFCKVKNFGREPLGHGMIDISSTMSQFCPFEYFLVIVSLRPQLDRNLSFWPPRGFSQDDRLIGSQVQIWLRTAHRNYPASSILPQHVAFSLNHVHGP